eukprot:CAMPEP_0118693458 /NCGR_PEP_ID=MMETSP0800-20121206/11924_1 /TAXON_ID=210618 ORGANISM="Striatella unipunctata, Strain CCMP2910" /NCGR_SAMPLE_ID=MMETSP0800 /ASSEMBLY_ACC=CAM_ASM_000638 /LENGTH=346 /DNA_ID=CAMNT_0006591705 /DNA_START=77 /DNA_END=1117 /DNA_ORIENTATION=-
MIETIFSFLGGGDKPTTPQLQPNNYNNSTTESLESIAGEKAMTAVLKGDWDFVSRVLTLAPRVAKQRVTFHLFKEKTQASLLHAIVSYSDAPVALVEKAIHANPFAITSTDTKHQCLPIHIALYNKAPKAVVDAILNATTHAFNNTNQDRDGNTPLHVACFVASSETALKLIQKDPTSVFKCNEKKQLPLHMACSRSDPSKQVVDKLIEIHPKAVEAKNWQNRYPLHVACVWKGDVGIVEELTRLYPRALRELDNTKRSPYDLATATTTTITTTTTTRGGGGSLYKTDPIVNVLRNELSRDGSFWSRTRDQAKFAKEDCKARRRRHHGRRGSKRQIVAVRDLMESH